MLVASIKGKKKRPVQLQHGGGLLQETTTAIAGTVRRSSAPPPFSRLRIITRTPTGDAESDERARGAFGETKRAAEKP